MCCLPLRAAMSRQGVRETEEIGQTRCNRSKPLHGQNENESKVAFSISLKHKIIECFKKLEISHGRLIFNSTFKEIFFSLIDLDKVHLFCYFIKSVKYLKYATAEN